MGTKLATATERGTPEQDRAWCGIPLGMDRWTQRETEGSRADGQMRREAGRRGGGTEDSRTH